MTTDILSKIWLCFQKWLCFCKMSAILFKAQYVCRLTHWGRVTHICVSKLIIIGSYNGLSPDRRQAIIWTNARLLSIGPLRIYFNENLIKIQQFSLKKMHVKLSSAKWRPSCLGLNVLRSKHACCDDKMLTSLGKGCDQSESWSEFKKIWTSICKEMCKKLLVLTKSCSSPTEGPTFVYDTDCK